MTVNRQRADELALLLRQMLWRREEFNMDRHLADLRDDRNFGSEPVCQRGDIPRPVGAVLKHDDIRRISVPQNVQLRPHHGFEPEHRTAADTLKLGHRDSYNGRRHAKVSIEIRAGGTHTKLRRQHCGDGVSR